jgi:hypothetical protein
MSQITVYWASPSGSHLIKDPERVFDYFTNNKSNVEIEPRNNVFGCPATRNFYKNLYVFKSNIFDMCRWPEGYLKNLVDQEFKGGFLQKFGNTRDFAHSRKSVLNGYIDLSYSLNFVMFASEPLMAQFTAPYAPPFSPIDGAIFTNGQFDIGQWFRPAALQFFVPTTATQFMLRKNDPLFYLQLMTDKKVVFQKFNATESARELAMMYMSSPERHGPNKPLDERYAILEKEGIRQRVLEEIQKNLI